MLLEIGLPLKISSANGPPMKRSNIFPCFPALCRNLPPSPTPSAGINVLHHDHVAFHALDFTDADDLVPSDMPI
jgi:hypothetical protein